MVVENSCFNTIPDNLVSYKNSKELNWASTKLKWLESMCLMFGYMCTIWGTNKHTSVGRIWGWIDSSRHHINYNYSNDSPYKICEDSSSAIAS